MLRMAGRDPRQSDANLAHVVAVAGQILLEKFFSAANTFQDHKAKRVAGTSASHEPMASPLAGAAMSMRDNRDAA